MQIQLTRIARAEPHILGQTKQWKYLAGDVDYPKFPIVHQQPCLRVVENGRDETR